MRVSVVTFAAILSLTSFSAMANNMTCMSANNAFTRCDLPKANDLHVQILKVKTGNCDIANAWGADSQGIWVDKGCGAEFLYNAPNNAQSASENAEVVVAPAIINEAGYYAYDPVGNYYYNNYNGDCNADGKACSHWERGYQAGRNDSYKNLHNDYTRHQGEFDKNHERDFSRGYAGGFHGGGFHGGGGRR